MILVFVTLLLCTILNIGIFIGTVHVMNWAPFTIIKNCKPKIHYNIIWNYKCVLDYQCRSLIQAFSEKDMYKEWGEWGYDISRHLTEEFHNPQKYSMLDSM